MTTAFRIVIPARYASTRLPAKPLADIGGRPMVLRVFDRVQAAGASQVWIATDHAEVYAVAAAAGARVMLTRADHASGTDRLAEVAERCGWADEDIVVNVQGDEPLIDPALVAAVADALAADRDASVATAAHALASAEEAFNPNVVKVVCDRQDRALYFSRAPIPWARDAWDRDRNDFPQSLPMLRHIGLYAYRVGFLRRYGALQPSPLEQWEALEQLRVLWHGERIRVLRVDEAPAAGVDTADDLERVRAAFAAGRV